MICGIGGLRKAKEGQADAGSAIAGLALSAAWLLAAVIAFCFAFRYFSTPRIPTASFQVGRCVTRVPEHTKAAVETGPCEDACRQVSHSRPAQGRLPGRGRVHEISALVRFRAGLRHVQRHGGYLRGSRWDTDRGNVAKRRPRRKVRRGIGPASQPATSGIAFSRLVFQGRRLLWRDSRQRSGRGARRLRRGPRRGGVRGVRAARRRLPRTRHRPRSARTGAKGNWPPTHPTRRTTRPFGCGRTFLTRNLGVWATGR